jgi:predicted nucleic acid-binding protein
MVAAIALQNDLVLVTGNLKHFARIQSLGFPLSLQDWRN